MIDVGSKESTHRIALASGAVHLSPATLRKIAAGEIEKGDVLATARLAAIMAAKRTPDIVPLCHPIGLTAVVPELTLDEAASAVRVQVRVETRDRTGVEMEALTAVSAACLTVYDMCKSVDPGMTIEAVRLEEKHGGKNGSWIRSTPQPGT